MRGVNLLGWKYTKLFAGDQLEAHLQAFARPIISNKKAKTRQEFAFSFISVGLLGAGFLGQRVERIKIE